MPETIYWYDFETTGTDPILDRPVQFAGIRTDLDLNEVGEPQNVICHPGADVIPQPGAMLVTGIRMSKLKTEGLTEKEFVESVLNQFEVPQTCVTGFNSIRFDDEFTRQMLYRNFRDPYAREWRNGNSRWDVIDLFRAAYALRPEGFEWPMREPDVPSFRLEDLARANGLEHLDAHDALADVRATIEVTAMLRRAQPRLYDFAFRLKDKKTVIQQLYPLGKQAVVHVSSMYPAAKGCTAVVLPICQHPTNSNAIICFDLSQSPAELVRSDPESLARLVFSPRSDLGEDEARIALKAIYVNRSPIVAPLSTLGEQEAARLGIELDLCREHMQEITQAAGIVEKIQDAYLDRRFDDHDDPDFQLYSGGFASEADRATMNAIVSSEPVSLATFANRFQDDRFNEMLFRYRARNWPEQLGDEEQQRWNEFKSSRWAEDGRLEIVLQEISWLRNELEGEELALIEDLGTYIAGL